MLLLNSALMSRFCGNHCICPYKCPGSGARKDNRQEIKKTTTSCHVTKWVWITRVLVPQFHLFLSLCNICKNVCGQEAKIAGKVSKTNFLISAALPWRAAKSLHTLDCSFSCCFLPGRKTRQALSSVYKQICLCTSNLFHSSKYFTQQAGFLK